MCKYHWVFVRQPPAIGFAVGLAAQTERGQPKLAALAAPIHIANWRFYESRLRKKCDLQCESPDVSFDRGSRYLVCPSWNGSWRPNTKRSPALLE
jgi:hypothetical protein